MKFVISRTSIWGEEKPCEEAKLEEVWGFNFRCASVERMKKIDSVFYNSNPKPVDIEKNRCVRWYKTEVWTIELDLKDLMTFSKKYGELVINNKPFFAYGEKEGDYKNILPRIEIYDDYRE